MKGAVFIAFNEMVEEKIGLEVWEQLLTAVNPPSGGIYTSVESYPDEELLGMVAKLAEIVEQPVPTLVEQFGAYMFGVLNQKYPIFTQQQPDFFSFLQSIDEVIHKEVRKLYENPGLPSLDCEQLDDNTLMIKYRSPRKLCVLAEGLIRGAALHYQVDYQLGHETCALNGGDHCLLKVTI